MAARQIASPVVYRGECCINTPQDQATLRVCVALPYDTAAGADLHWMSIPQSSTVSSLCAAAAATVRMNSAPYSSSDDCNTDFKSMLQYILSSGQHLSVKLHSGSLWLSGDDDRPLSDVPLEDRCVLTWEQPLATPSPAQIPAESPEREVIQLPLACLPRHFCIPSMPYMQWLSEARPDTANATLARIQNFTICHPSYGAATWLGSCDVRELDLSEVQLGPAEVVLPPGLLPCTAQVCLRGVQGVGQPAAAGYKRSLAESRAVQFVKQAGELAETADTEAEWAAHHALLLKACPRTTQMILSDTAPETVNERDAADETEDASPVGAGDDAALQTQLRSACSQMGAFYVMYDEATREWVFNIAA